MSTAFCEVAARAHSEGNPARKRLALLPGVYRSALASASPAHGQAAITNRRRVARAPTFPAGSPPELGPRWGCASPNRRSTKCPRNPRSWRAFIRMSGTPRAATSSACGLLESPKLGISRNPRPRRLSRNASCFREQWQAPDGTAVRRAKHLGYGEDPWAERERASASLRVSRAAACLRARSARVRRRPRLAPSEASMDRQYRRARRDERHGPPKGCPQHSKSGASKC